MLTDRIDPDEAYLTRAQAADELQVSVRTVDRYIADGILTITKLPGARLVRIPRSAIKALLTPTAPAPSPFPRVDDAGAFSSSPDVA
ncbi:helix-turn-helix domain-containing protein [Marisediminicola sp. LYQ134]|uniref:helix-turn-helix domain-containing protein n=1 Tax=Marisediminicola sp. LYQ134 TaxID=3391061 RepID=UPI003983D757